MQVEDVAGVRLAARWATKEQRELTVGLSLLRKVVVDDEGVLAVLHPLLSEGATGERGEELERRRVAGGGDHDHGVLHGTRVLEELHGLGHRRVLLTDGHVDALNAEALLVQDGVDGDRGLARLTVTDDQLTLATADRGHGVNGLDAGLERLAHRLTTGDARGLDLHASSLGGVQRALAIDRLTESVDDTTQQGVAAGDLEDAAGGTDHLLLLELVDVAEHDRTDRLLVEVHGEAQRAVLELEQLVHRRAGKARHACDAVGDLDDAAHLLRPNLRGVVGDVALERLGDLICADGQFCHVSSSMLRCVI